MARILAIAALSCLVCSGVLAGVTVTQELTPNPDGGASLPATWNLKGMPNPNSEWHWWGQTPTFATNQPLASGSMNCWNDSPSWGQTGQVRASDAQNSIRWAVPHATVLIDLGKWCDLREFNTFSWADTAAGTGQQYTLYGSTGVNSEPNPNWSAPAWDAGQTDFVAAGWTKIADVDTQASGISGAGQLGVSIADNASYGEHLYRWLMMDIHQADSTYFGEIDIQAAPPLPGDADRNGRVDFQDYLVLEASFGGPPTGPYRDADLDGNGIVDFEDYLIMEARFEGEPIPEPATLSLLAAVTVMLLRRRHLQTA